jgi:hypothetical protein
MIWFFTIFGVSIISLLAVQALDVECARKRSPRRNPVFDRGVRTPLRVSFRNMLDNGAR